MVNPTPSAKSVTSTSNKTGSAESPKSADAVKSSGDAPVVDPSKPESPAASTAPGAEKPDTTIVSITVSTRLAAKARLLSRIRGCTISSLFTDAAAREIPVALKAALADMRDEDIE
ncbi:MAG: hypothetical protein ACHREM_04310 [Polyangiales bacterium]